MNLIEKIGIFLYRVSDKLNIKTSPQGKSFVSLIIVSVLFPLSLFSGNKEWILINSAGLFLGISILWDGLKK